MDELAPTPGDGALRRPRAGSRSDAAWVNAAAAAYAAVTGWLAWRLPVWRDEIYTVQTTAGGIRAAAARAVHFELQAPGYFVLEAAWQRIAPGPLAARVLSVVFGTLTVLVGAALFARLVPGVRAGIGALVVATSPIVIWAGSEARCYALVLLLGVGFVHLLLRVHLEGWTRGRPLLVLVAAAALYVQYYLGFLLLGGAAALLLCRRWRELGAYLLEMAAVAALFAPHVPMLVQALMARSHQGHPNLPTLGEIVFPVETGLTQLALGSAAARLGGAAGRALHWACRLALASALAAVLWRARRAPGTGVPAAVTLGIAVVAMAAGTTATMIAGVPWHLKYWCGFSLVALFLPIVLARAAGPRAATAAALLLSASGVGAAVIEHRTLGKWGDSRAVAETLSRAEAPGEPILVVPADAILSLAYYYRGVNWLEPVPRQPSNEVYTYSDIMPQTPEDLRGAVRRVGDPTAFWLYSDMPEVEDQLEPWLAPRWRVERHLRFPGGRTGTGHLAVAHLRRFVRAE